MGKIHFTFICLACEIIRFFRLKFLVSPPEKTRNLSRKNRMLLQAIICRTSLNFARQEHCKTQSLTETSRGFSAVSVVEKAQRQGVRSSCAPQPLSAPLWVLHTCTMTSTGRLCPKGGTSFRLQVYKRVEISLAEVYERVGKCVISVS